MRLIHCAGLNGNAKKAIDTIREWSINEEAKGKPIDVVVVSGNLLRKDQCWGYEEYYKKFVESRETLAKLKEKLDKKRQNIDPNKTSFILRSPEFGSLEQMVGFISSRIAEKKEYAAVYGNIVNEIKCYGSIIEETREIMLNHYRTLKKSLFKFKPQILVIPGENDTTLLNAVFILESLHFKPKKAIKEVTFAGGGYSIQIPKHILKELRREKVAESELETVLMDTLTHLSTENPDVAVITVPPYDQNKEPHGNVEVRNYIEKKQPKLVLCGHMLFENHIPNSGLHYIISNTSVVNTGSLDVDNLFADVVLDDAHYVAEVGFYEIKESGNPNSVTEVHREYVAKLVE